MSSLLKGLSHVGRSAWRRRGFGMVVQMGVSRMQMLHGLQSSVTAGLDARRGDENGGAQGQWDIPKLHFVDEGGSDDAEVSVGW